MGKFDAVRRLSKSEIDELFINFAKALASVHNSIEAANLIKDLLTESEIIIIARRLQIARLLAEKFTYEQIHKIMRVGNTTIAKVHTWMNLYGEGFKTVIKRTKSYYKVNNKINDSFSWSSHKKRFPLYHWPELILKEIVNSASKKEKQKLLKVVTEIKEKTKISKELLILLQKTQNSHTPAYGRMSRE